MCWKCKKNYVITTSSQKYVTCYDCQKNLLNSEIKSPVFKKLFDIPEDYYKTSAFLRDIKLNYLKYNNLTEKQIAAFKKVVEQMKEISK